MTSVAREDVESLWRQFGVDLRAFVRRRVARPDDAEDIVQLVFLRMLDGQESLRDAGRLTGWLYATARNAITDHYRSAARRRETLVTTVPDHVVPEHTLGAGIGSYGPEEAEHEQAEQEQAEQELARCLRPMISHLPAEQAEAVRMVDLAGMSQVDAATAARVSYSGMRSRVQRGRARLRTMLLACCRIEQDVRGRVQGCQARNGRSDERQHGSPQGCDASGAS